MTHNISINPQSIPTIQFIYGGRQVKRPITDHPPIIQNTAWGAMATMNMLHPGSPIAPPAQIGGVKTLPAQGQQQMTAMAQYIFNMFQAGVGVLTLQEVPDPHSQNFGFLVAELKRLVGTSKLIDVDSLAKQWLKTGTHVFGTSILYNPNRFSITQNAKPDLNNRAAEYELTDIYTHYKIPVSNLHGDFAQQTATAQYIKGFDGLCLGDANLSSFVPSANPLVFQTATTPSLVVEGKVCNVNTFDIFQDTYSKKTNPHFIPDRTNISQPPVRQVGFAPQVFQIAPQNAKPYLADFANYLVQNGKGHLILSGRVKGITLTTPGAQSNITISDAEVHQAFLIYDQIQQAKATVKSPIPPVFQPQVYRVAPQDAVPLLTVFAKYLALKGQSALINSQGRIQGIVLTTPGDQSHITINDEEVNKHYLAFGQIQKTKKDEPLVFQPIVIQFPAKNAKPFLNDFAAYLVKRGREDLASGGMITGVSLKTPLVHLSSGKKIASEMANITIADAKVYQALQEYQQKLILFTQEKDALQTHFLDQLDLLHQKIQRSEKPGSVAYVKGEELYTKFFDAQQKFFNKFTPYIDSVSLQANLNDFCKTCDENTRQANAIMGPVWLSRQLTSFCKFVSAIVVGLGMIIGAVVLQGVAKQEHRERYAQTFFKSDWNETNSTKALKDFQQVLNELKDEVDGLDKRVFI